VSSPAPWAVAGLLLAFVLGPLLTSGRTLPVGVCGESLVIAKGRLLVDSSDHDARFVTDFPGGTYLIGNDEDALEDLERPSVAEAFVIGWASPCEAVGRDGVPLDPWLMLAEPDRD